MIVRKKKSSRCYENPWEKIFMVKDWYMIRTFQATETCPNVWRRVFEKMYFAYIMSESFNTKNKYYDSTVVSHPHFLGLTKLTAVKWAQLIDTRQTKQLTLRFIIPITISYKKGARVSASGRAGCRCVCTCLQTAARDEVPSRSKKWQLRSFFSSNNRFLTFWFLQVNVHGGLTINSRVVYFRILERASFHSDNSSYCPTRHISLHHSFPSVSLQYSE